MTETMTAGDATGGEAGASEARPFAILHVPNPALKGKARRVTEADRALVDLLVPSMLRTMYEAPGIGLAAPQVGVPLRLVVVDLAEEGERGRVPPLVLVNPEIVARSAERSVREEGCLSIPGIYADIERPARVAVRHQDHAFATRTTEADGLLAACLQHEIDHLDGILFVDHLSALRRNMLLRRFAKEQRASGGPSRPASVRRDGPATG